MSAKASEQEISQSVLDFVTDGTYPESERIVTSGISTAVLVKELELISKAREQVEVSGVNCRTPHYTSLEDSILNYDIQ